MQHLSVFVFSILVFCSQAQVAKRIAVEHFTNTVCAICANRNPGFYENLENFPGVIHLAIHPSAPYNSCIFNQHNQGENDARTNFYGIYGATPRLVIQGEVIAASANYGSASLISQYENEMSSYEMSLVQEYPSSLDSLRVQVTITLVATSGETTARLYAALAESEIEYNGPNGESKHYDVFRESLFGTDGIEIELPTTLNDPKTFTATVAMRGDWNRDELYAMALIQDTGSNMLLQAVSAEGEMITYTGPPGKMHDVSIYPNPASGHLNIAVDTPGNTNIKLVDATGRIIVFQRDARANIEVDLKGIPAGSYFVEVSTNGVMHRSTVIIR